MDRFKRCQEGGINQDNDSRAFLGITLLALRRLYTRFQGNWTIAVMNWKIRAQYKQLSGAIKTLPFFPLSISEIFPQRSNSQNYQLDLDS